jgi:replicative DNA helicase
MAQHKLDLVIVDYLQLMTGPENAGSREQEVSNISRSLKSIAKELNVPIIALSQLNRSVEMRGGTKRPLLSDLRESGAIEQDADMVVFIHRQEKFGITEFLEDGSSTKGIAEIIVAKNRNGPVGDVKLRFREEKAQFVDIDEFDMDASPEPGGTQSIILGSKMNHDKLRNVSGKFDNEFDNHEEPPFA